MTGRSIEHEYRDPLELVWLQVLEELGFKLERSHEVFAAFDGKHTLTLCSAEHFDADDCLAQMIFHELCHALVAGDAGRQRADWGLENTDQRDLFEEYACLRLQAQLSGDYGLRDFFAVTTDHRARWDRLRLNPLADEPASSSDSAGNSDSANSADPSIGRARLAYHRACHGPWANVLQRALRATQDIATIARSFAPPSSLWLRSRQLHPIGYPRHTDASLQCGACAWLSPTGNCFRTANFDADGAALHISRDEPACERFEPAFDAAECARCGACCREGFHRVELTPGEAFERKHLDLVSRDKHGAYVARPDGRCVALSGLAEPEYRCQAYADRPRACADFEVGGAACLEARRRVGLSL